MKALRFKRLLIEGIIYDVVVDLRRGSPSFGHWSGTRLCGENEQQLFLLEGFGHGFCVMSETAHVLYKCTDFYAPDDEGGILWSDHALAIDWPVSDPLLSEEDSQYPCLADFPLARLSVFVEDT